MTNQKKTYLALAWIAIWLLVGWRGYEMVDDAQAFIAALPTGKPIPDLILNVIAWGKLYFFSAVFAVTAGVVFILRLRKRRLAKSE